MSKPMREKLKKIYSKYENKIAIQRLEQIEPAVSIEKLKDQATTAILKLISESLPDEMRTPNGENCFGYDRIDMDDEYNQALADVRGKLGCDGYLK